MAHAGVAISRDGITWQRGFDTIEGSRGADAAADVGSVMHPNKDWWTFDTCHLAPGDVQVRLGAWLGLGQGLGLCWTSLSDRTSKNGSTRPCCDHDTLS